MSAAYPVLLALLAGVLVAVLWYRLSSSLRRYSRRLFGRDQTFPSYSRKDETVVIVFSEMLKAIGNESLRDRTHIFGGEDWRKKIRSLITRADRFLLFWSESSAASKEVRAEWEYALSLNRQTDFIYGVYWDEDRPPFPTELARINFEFIDFERLNRAEPLAFVTRQQKAPVVILIVFLTSLITIMAATFVAARKILAENDPPRTTSSPNDNSPSIPADNKNVIQSPPPPSKPAPAASVQHDFKAAPRHDHSPVSVTRLEKTVVVVGTSLFDSVNLTNRTSDPLRIDSRLTGANATEFRIVSNDCGDVIPARGTCKISFTFTPYASGLRRARLTLTSNETDRGITVSLMAKAAEVTLLTNRARLDFESVRVGKTKHLTVTASTRRAIFAHRSWYQEDINSPIMRWSPENWHFQDIVTIQPNRKARGGRPVKVDIDKIEVEITPPSPKVTPLEERPFAITEIKCLNPAPRPPVPWNCTDLSITVSFSPTTAKKYGDEALVIHTLLRKKTILLTLSGRGIQ